MRRFYSLLLTAAFLLVGMNAWGTTHEAATVEEFKAKWSAAASGDVIKLTDDITLNGGIDVVLWLGTTNQNDAAKSITIDLAGHDLASYASNAFVITHGELKIITSVISEGHNKVTHTGSKETFFVTGSTKKDVDPSVDGSNYFTHLVIGENVTVERPQLTTTITKPDDNTSKAYRDYVNDKYRNYKNAAIAIDAIYGTLQSTNYYTNVYAKNDDKYRGIANGVRIDIYGTVNGLRYGIKPNGYLCNVSYFINKRRGGEPLPAEGVSPLYTDSEKLDQSYKIQDGDDSYSPFIHIYPTGKVTALAETPAELVNDMYAPKADSETSRTYWGTPTALYGGGYARWIVEGTAQGASGAIIKSGNVVLNDATIEGLGTYVSATHTTSSNTGEGSGLLVVSDNSWAGSVSVISNGTTTVSSEKGYAVEETVPADATQETKVENITINGGTFYGGTDDQGKSHAIIISEVTQTANADPTVNTKVEVYSATVEGDVQVASVYESEAWERLIPTEATDVQIAEDDNGNKTVVVTVLSTPETIAQDLFDIDNAVDTKNYDLSNLVDGNRNQIFDRDENKTMTLGSLTINPANIDEDFDDQKEVRLTIDAGHTLIADKVLLGEKGYIVVEAGATLIIKGTEGITSTTAEHIVLKANATDQATFLLNPAVVNNSEPNAKVELYTICHQMSSNPWYYKFQEFALPVKVQPALPANSNYEVSDLFEGDELETYLRRVDYEQNKIVYFTGWAATTPFTFYQIANNTKENTNITYTFEGQLLGNKNRYCQFHGQGFGYFGNSHLAPISVTKLLADFGEDIQKTVWVYDYSARQYKYVNANSSLFGAAFTEIKPLQAFVLYLNEGSTSTAPINYANVVWGNPRFNSVNGNSAPARVSANTLSNGALINVVAVNGNEDQVILMEDNAYTADFENGADASKLMNKDGIDLYVATANGNLSIVADNNIENTLLSFKAGEATEYTLQLGKVFGEDYAIRDNVTGVVFNCVEGTEYAFTQAANTLESGRFEIIAAAKMPTAIENTNVKASAKGIYTLLGQYLGENFEILPAGVYVVNGKKIVK